MRVLLFSMPDSFEHTPALTMRMPNGALASLAGNAGREHRVAVADLILVQRHVAETVERLMREHDPDVVGVSVMTFQRHTALKLVRLIRAIKPDTTVVAGGYDPSLAPEAYEPPSSGIDYIVRGEGELTFRELLHALSCGAEVDRVAGLSFRDGGGSWKHTPQRPVTRLEDGMLALPDRGARVLRGYTFLGRQIDIVETSRGCTYDCSFCSIVRMRGRNFHRFDFTRVLADIADARGRGARAIFLVDDNITLDVQRFASLCHAITEARLNDVPVIVQAMTSSIANHGDTLAPLMRRAGFRYVFLGIENVLDEDLEFLRAAAKNAQRDGGRRTGNASLSAIQKLHAHGLAVVGGIIVGNPGDTRESIETNLAFARRYVDWPYIQHPTPYPGTPMAEDFRARGLIVNERVEEYDGTTAVVRTAHLDAEEVEFLRWRAERWMKLRHLPSVLWRYPGFVVRNAPRMCAHTFRGTTWRYMLGLETERQVFGRYKMIRSAERNYLGPVIAHPQQQRRSTVGGLDEKTVRRNLYGRRVRGIDGRVCSEYRAIAAAGADDATDDRPETSGSGR